MFGAVKLTKHVDVDQYKYFGYDIGFGRKGSSLIGNEIGRNVITFEAVMSSSTKLDNRKRDILILGKCPTQGLEHTLSAERMYSINFIKESTKFGLCLHYNGANTYLLVNGKQIYKVVAKDSENIPYELCLGNIGKDWSVDNMKKTGLKGCVYGFSVDYDSI